MITVQNRGLPDLVTLRRLAQSLATLDAIIMPEWEFRYYSYNSKWDAGEQTASMRNGSGAHFFLLFKAAGAILKGFVKDSRFGLFCVENSRVWPGVLEQIPPQFSDILTEPAFMMASTTFCTWRGTYDESWHIGPVQFPEGVDPDGSLALLKIFDGDPRTYQSWAEQYYERKIPLLTVKHIYDHQTLTDEMVHSLEPDRMLALLHAELDEIGYPYKR